MLRISASRPVFELRHTYEDVISEVASILARFPNALFVIENCFSLHIDRLLGVSRQIASSRGSLLLTSRTIASDAESGKIKRLAEVSTFRSSNIGRLSGTEIDALITLIDQMAGWRDFPAMSHTERHRYVDKDCNGVLPSVLLRILQSEYVRDQYRQEYNKLSFSSELEKNVVIACLIISSLGFDPTSSFISDLFQKDVASVASAVHSNGGSLKLFAVRSGVVHTIPSIGARTFLKGVIPDRSIVNATISVLEALADERGKTDFEKHIFSQLMRYSILASTVEDEIEINRFFDHISKVNFYREMPLFWLQWHMAMCAQKKWLKAEDFLKMGNKAADVFDRKRDEKYNRKQLEDRRAKFLSERALSELRSATDLFRDMKEALDIVGRLLRSSDVTYHPFETLAVIAKTLSARAALVMEVQLPILLSQAKGVVELAEKRLGVVPDGYQRANAKNHYEAARVLLGTQ